MFNKGKPGFKAKTTPKKESPYKNVIAAWLKTGQYGEFYSMKVSKNAKLWVQLDGQDEPVEVTDLLMSPNQYKDSESKPDWIVKIKTE